MIHTNAIYQDHCPYHNYYATRQNPKGSSIKGIYKTICFQQKQWCGHTIGHKNIAYNTTPYLFLVYTTLAILHSGTISYYPIFYNPVLNKQKASNPKTVKISNGNLLTFTKTCDINLPMLPTEAHKGNIISA